MQLIVNRFRNQKLLALVQSILPILFQSYFVRFVNAPVMCNPCFDNAVNVTDEELVYYNMAASV